MKKGLVAAAGLTALCSCLAGCAPKAPDTLELVEKKGELVVAAPRAAQEDMSRAWAADLEQEVLDSLGRRLGVDIRYEYVEPGDEIQAVAGGRADIAAGVAILEESGNDGYSITYGTRPVYVAAAGTAGINSPGELADSNVGFSPDMEQVKSQLYSVTGVTMVGVEDADSAEASIKEGKIDRYICGEAEARKLLSQSGISVRDLSGVRQESYAFYAGKDQYRILGELNRLLTEKLKD